MTTPRDRRYAGYRFPAEVIATAVWLYFRFPLSLRMVEEMLAARGITVSHETVRQWALKFGRDIAMSRAGGRPSTTRSPIFSTFAETTAPLPTTATPAPRHSPPGPRSPARRWPRDRPAPGVRGYPTPFRTARINELTVPFLDTEALIAAMREERPGKRDIAFYLEDPHVVLAQAPNELFLDPSHTFRLRLWAYKDRPQLRGFDVGAPRHRRDIEANERPGLANHEPQPTAERFIDLLFPYSAI